MALFSRLHVWVSNEILTAAALNAEFNNILNNMLASSIIGTSQTLSAMQTTASPGGVGTEQLAGNVAVEIQQLRYMLNSLNGGAQWYSAPTRNLTNLALTTSDLTGVTLPRTQLSTLTPVVSATANFTGTQTGSPQNFVITNLSVTITTTGRPVQLKLISALSGGEPSTAFVQGAISLSMTVGATDGTVPPVSDGKCDLFATLYFIRTLSGTPTIISYDSFGAHYLNGKFWFSGGTGFNPSEVFTHAVPASAFGFIDNAPAAGTYTYSVDIFTNCSVPFSGSFTGATLDVSQIKLIAYEIA